MGSAAWTNEQDQRVGIEGDVGQIAAPGSALSNLLGPAINIGDHSGNSDPSVSYGDITINEFTDEVSAMVSDILDQNQQTLTTFSEPLETMTGVVEAIKTPLSKYLPYFLIAAIVFISVKFSKG